MLPTITVDIGTTSVKLRRFDADGRVLDAARHPTPSMADTWGEIYDLDALDAIVTGFVRDVDAAGRAAVQRIAITGVGESGGLVRSDGSLASPMILWHDQRGAPFLERLTDAERHALYRITGLPASANYGLSKIAWAVEHAGAALGDAQWLNIAEYLATRLTGRRWSEPSLASRTMALDVRAGAWSAEVLALAGLPAVILPELRAAAQGVPAASGVARELGLSSDVLVHVAGHDHMVGAVGADLGAGELLNSTGTTEGLLFRRGRPMLDEAAEQAKLANGLACDADTFTLFASIPTGGSAFATLQSVLGLPAERLTACLADLHGRYVAGRIDLDGLPIVLPQFRGSPPPTKRPTARGVIAGIRTDTTTDELVLGCFVGMALQFRDVLRLFPDRPAAVKVIGPAAENPLWVQLKADLLGLPMLVSRDAEVVSIGAQALASGAACTWEDRRPSAVEPDPARHERLGTWADDVAPVWAHLQGVPA